MREYVRRYGDSVAGIGIDTWGVDFGLLSSEGTLLENPVHYRDRRTEGMLEEVRRRIAPEVLFQRTGMGLAPINTSVQLLALRVRHSSVLAMAAKLLMMPDLFAYFLTGQKYCERSQAITTQLYDPWKGLWCEEVMRVLGLPLSLMPELVDPATTMGDLREGV